MLVLALDRNWTMDVDTNPNHHAVPIEWARYWAHEQGHEVWAIGEQELTEEAEIPGVVEMIRRRDGNIEALGEQDADGQYEWWPEREERLDILSSVFPDAERRIVVDDWDFSHLQDWEHYHGPQFVELVREGDLPLAEPPDSW